MEQRNGYSLLGFGCMRLPSDYETSKALIKEALDGGITYFDTAYMYQGNEVLLGKILDELDRREEATLATKVQPFMFKNLEDLEKRFAQHGDLTPK